MTLIGGSIKIITTGKKGMKTKRWTAMKETKQWYISEERLTDNEWIIRNNKWLNNSWQLRHTLKRVWTIIIRRINLNIRLRIRLIITMRGTILVT